MDNITKKGIVTRISEKTGLTQIDAGIAVDALLDAISNELKSG